MSTTMVIVLPAKGSALVALQQNARTQDTRHDTESRATNHETGFRR
jgi:hypothetical protein